MFNFVTPSVLLVLLLSSTLYPMSFAVANQGQNNQDQSNEEQSNEEQSDEDWGDDWGDESEQNEQALSPWQTHGFIQYSYGDHLQNNPLFVPTDNTLHEIRGQLNVKYNHDSFVINAKSDLYYDEVTSNWHYSQRQLNLAAQLSDNLDIKLGRQILTWGTGDYLFLNDLFPKDWQSFFAGRDDAYLKAPSDNIKLSYYHNDTAFELVWTPQFTPDNYLTGERFSFYSPMQQRQVAPGPAFNAVKPNNSQLASRIKWQYNNIELAVYGYKGYVTTPNGINAQGQFYFPKMNSLGASFITPTGKGILKGEMAHYDVKSPLNDNSNQDQTRILIGYEQEMFKDLTASVQGYVERNPSHKNRTLGTLRLTYAMWQQTLNASLFVFYSPSDNDAYLKPKLTYKYNDNWHISAGANLFKGKHHDSFFGQHQDNSNAFVSIKWLY